ncbi:hypothetical protein Q3G72_028988 [Acer saccharum]|nr:hypothetical protein Q3G72_028988 [Acer saccharum]
MMKCYGEAGCENPMFQRLYICLGALKKGWKEVVFFVSKRHDGVANLQISIVSSSHRKATSRHHHLITSAPTSRASIHHRFSSNREEESNRLLRLLVFHRHINSTSDIEWILHLTPSPQKVVVKLTKARHMQCDEVRVGGITKLRRNYITVRCSKCRQQGHNRTTCDKRAATESIGGNAARTESVGGNAAGTELPSEHVLL